MKTNPKMFFRYREFNEQTLASLCSDKVYFANPETFNDPMDCRPNVQRDSDLPSLRRLLEMLIQRRVAGEIDNALKTALLIGAKAEAHSQKVGAKSAKQALMDIAYHATNSDCGSSESDNESWLLTREIECELRSHYERGVCCFSESGLSPLLWSHYADNHKGLCIGYTAERLPRPVLRQAVYGGCRMIRTSTILKAFADQDLNALECLEREMLLRKAKCWNYEKEWRLIGDRGIRDSPLLLKEISFGLRCPYEVKHSVITALAGRSSAVVFFEVYPVRGKFTLRRRKVDLDELANSLPRMAYSAEEEFGERE